MTFFLSFHLLNIIFSCMELLQLPQKCCMIRNGRENVRERIICFGCGPDSKRTIAGFHHFLPSPLLVPISSNTLHDCGLPLSSPKPSLTSGIRVEVFLGQEKNMKFPFAALVVLIHFPGSCPCCPRLQAGLSAFLTSISAHLHTHANTCTGS